MVELGSSPMPISWPSTRSPPCCGFTFMEELNMPMCLEKGTPPATARYPMAPILLEPAPKAHTQLMQIKKQIRTLTALEFRNFLEKEVNRIRGLNPYGESLAGHDPR